MSSGVLAQNEPMTKRSAVIVDADPQIIGAVHEVLQSDRWNVLQIGDNQALLGLVQDQSLDLIITGPGTSGREDVELLRKIRRVRPHVKLIILTDQSTPADVIASMRERAFSYFSKPFSLSSLKDIVHMAVAEPPWDDGIEVISATPEWLSIIARCDIKTADRLVQFLKEISDLDDPEKTDVTTAFREMLLNAIDHGGNFDPTQYVEISYVRTRKMVMCRIKDPGSGFSLEEITHAAISNPTYDPTRHVFSREAQGLRPGGYGVLMAKHFVDELMYSEKGDEVLLIKYLRPGQV